MVFSNPTEYAIRGLSELALRNAVGCVMLEVLVAGTDLPRDFLAKIFQKLVKAGILRSAKGRGGGFCLTRPAQEVTLLQIVEAIDGPEALDRCVVGLERCSDEMACPQHELYKPLRQQFRDYVTRTTLAALADSLRAKKAAIAAVAAAAPVPPGPATAPAASAAASRPGTKTTTRPDV